MDMVQDEIGDYFQAALMGSPDEGFERSGIAKMRLYLCGRNRPVAVIAGIPPMRFGIFLKPRLDSYSTARSKLC